MKKIFILISLLVCFTACSTTKKSKQTDETSRVLAQKSESEVTNSEKLIDTTKTENGKVTITEIEFYPPMLEGDTIPKDQASPTTGTNVSGLKLHNVGNIGTASIKSIKQTTIEKDFEKKGESKESSSETNVKNEAVEENTEKIVKIDEEPAPDPYRWRYIFYILLLGAIAFLYLKRVPVLNWIKTILSNIFRIS